MCALHAMKRNVEDVPFLVENGGGGAETRVVYFTRGSAKGDHRHEKNLQGNDIEFQSEHLA